MEHHKRIMGLFEEFFYFMKTMTPMNLPLMNAEGILYVTTLVQEAEKAYEKAYESRDGYDIEAAYAALALIPYAKEIVHEIEMCMRDALH